MANKKNRCQRGIKRFVRQVLALSGEIVLKNGTIKHLTLNPFYPLIGRLRLAFEALLRPYEIQVSLGKT